VASFMTLEWSNHLSTMYESPFELFLVFFSRSKKKKKENLKWLSMPSYHYEEDGWKSLTFAAK
jgi:hypothetical protein